jgi:hypothetical protein
MLWLGVATVATVLFGVQSVRTASEGRSGAEPLTFAKDIAPIFQAKCQNCHRPGSVAPMSFLTYDETRPYAKSIKARTALGGKPEVMPPWFVDKSIGIQHFKDDMSLTDVEIAKIAAWVDTGAAAGDLSKVPAAIPKTAEANRWELGQPDLIVKSPSIEIGPTAPDWYGPMGETPTGLTEDRYAASVEVHEITDSAEVVDATRKTIGGQAIMHHLAWTPVPPRSEDPIAASRETRETPSDYWPVHEVGRNPDIFDPDAGKLMKAGSKIVFNNVHLHANGRKMKAHVEMGFRFHPKGYKSTKQFVEILTSARDLDIPGMTTSSIQGFTVLRENTKIMKFEPHMHASGVRMCLDAIYDQTEQTLSCVGYNHGWIRVYTFEEGFQPLLPKGTILRMTAYFDATPGNKNIVDPRNWQGLGNRSIDNMAVSINDGLYLSDQEFQKEMEQRRQQQLTNGGSFLGCPLCGYTKKPVSVASK